MLVAVKDKEKTIVAMTNSFELKRLTKHDLCNEENRICVVKGDTIYCFSEIGRYTDIFLCDDKLYQFNIDEKTIIKDIIPYMINKIKMEKGMSEDEIWKEPNWETALIIIKDNRIFTITPMFYFREEDDYACFGSYNNLLYGSLDASKGEDGMKRVIKSFDVFEKMGHVDIYPLMVINTNDKKIQIWEK